MTDIINDVRLTLDHASNQLLTDDMITKSLADAQIYIDKYVQVDAPEQGIQSALKRIASWLCYADYTGIVTSTTGDVPESLATVVAEKCKIAELQLNLISSEEVFFSKKRRFSPNETMANARMYGNPTLTKTRSNNIG